VDVVYLRYFRDLDLVAGYDVESSWESVQFMMWRQ